MYIVINYEEFDEFKGLEAVQVTASIKGPIIESIPPTFQIVSQEPDISGAIFVKLQKRAEEKLERKFLDNMGSTLTNICKTKKWEPVFEEFKKRFGKSLVIGDQNSDIAMTYSHEHYLLFNRSDAMPSYHVMGAEKRYVAIPGLSVSVLSMTRTMQYSTEVEGHCIIQGDDQFTYIFTNNVINSKDADFLIPIFVDYAKTKCVKQELSDDLKASREIFQKITAEKVNNLNQSIKEMNETKNTYIAELVEISGKISRTQWALNALRDWKKNIDLMIYEQVNKLKSHPLVEEIHITGEVLRVDTKPLIGEIRKRTTLFGRMTIFINLVNGSVDISNKDFKFDGKSHPHQQGSGNICWGQNSGEIPKLIGEIELFAAVDIAIAFLSTSNPADPIGGHYVNWPEILPDKTLSWGSSISVLCKVMRDGKPSSLRKGDTFEQYYQNILHS